MCQLKKTTIPKLRKIMTSGTPITMITCYDYSMAHIVEKAGLDIVLVGDSLGMTLLGYDSTLPVTMDDMVRHTQAVRRGAPTRFVIGDMPYMSYQPSDETAVRNAGRLMAETGCDAVKIEGGQEMAPRVEAMVAAGVPVMGHIGLMPQSSAALGGFRLQGKTASKAARIIEDARILEDVGCFAILVEMVPDRVCRILTEQSKIPVISLGSGPHAHGQLLIFHDLFGLYPNFTPTMARRYVDAGEVLLSGLLDYVREVQSGDFPGGENYFSITDEELVRVKKLLNPRLTRPLSVVSSKD